AAAKPQEPVLPRGRFVDVITGGFECQPHHVPDVRFVVDDQHLHEYAPASAAWRLSPLPPKGWRPESGIVKANVEPRPGSDCTVRRPPCASTMRRAMVRP